MNNNAIFALLYISVISVALFSSIYASSLNAWNRVVFTFPSETQRVVENGTAVMEIRWRWFPETLEVLVKVNDDDFNETSPFVDCMALLFDSDHNGILTGQLGYNWTYKTLNAHNDYKVYISVTWSVAFNRGYIVHDPVDGYGSGWVFQPDYWMWIEIPHFHPNFIAYVNNSYCTYEEGEGYIFNLSIPKTLIDVEPPTPIHICFMDSDVWLRAIHDRRNIQDTIFANFTG